MEYLTTANEHLWNILQQRMNSYESYHRNKKQLKEDLLAKWYTIQKTITENLVKLIPDRLKAEIKSLNKII